MNWNIYLFMRVRVTIILVDSDYTLHFKSLCLNNHFLWFDLNACPISLKMRKKFSRFLPMKLEEQLSWHFLCNRQIVEGAKYSTTDSL